MIQKKKTELVRNIILIAVTIILIFILLFSSLYQKGIFSSTRGKPESKNEVSPTPEVIITPTSSPFENIVTPSPSNFPVPSPTPVVTSIPKEEAKEPFKNETELIRYMENKESFITSNKGKSDVGIIAKVKETFVSVIDFIFYDKEIGGYTFKELTTATKLQIIKIALSIDNKIDQYFPDYKTSIKSGYESIKAKAVKLYLDLTSSLCSKVGDRTCNQAKEDFAVMKKSFGFTFDIIKEAGGNLVDAIRTWYEIFREN